MSLLLPSRANTWVIGRRKSYNKVQMIHFTSGNSHVKFLKIFWIVWNDLNNLKYISCESSHAAGWGWCKMIIFSFSIMSNPIFLFDQNTCFTAQISSKTISLMSSALRIFLLKCIKVFDIQWLMTRWWREG